MHTSINPIIIRRINKKVIGTNLIGQKKKKKERCPYSDRKRMNNPDKGHYVLINVLIIVLGEIVSLINEGNNFTLD